MWDLLSKNMLKHKHVTFEFMLISNNNVNFIFVLTLISPLIYPTSLTLIDNTEKHMSFALPFQTRIQFKNYLHSI